MNLVTNAADAMSEEGGLLEVILEEILLQEEKEPEGEIRGGSERVLFVDDEESMVNLNRIFEFQRFGFQLGVLAMYQSRPMIDG